MSLNSDAGFQNFKPKKFLDDTEEPSASANIDLSARDDFLITPLLKSQNLNFFR